jgi:hypothetical protein
MSDGKKFDNSGSLWPNDYKEEGDNKPNMKGKLTVDGKEYEISAWTKTTDDNRRFLSLSVQKPWKERQSGGGGSAPASSEPSAPASSADKDDLPF